MLLLLYIRHLLFRIPKEELKAMNEKEIMSELNNLIRQKERWNTSIEDVLLILKTANSKEIKAKSLWLLGEMGLHNSSQVACCVDDDNVNAGFDRVIEACAGDVDRITDAIAGFGRPHLDTGSFADDLELLDGVGTLEV